MRPDCTPGGRRFTFSVEVLAIALLLAVGASCARRQPPPVARPVPPQPPAVATRPPTPPQPVLEVPVSPAPPIGEDPVAARSLDDLNRDSPLRPVLFAYDSAEISDAARAILEANAALLKKYPTWIVTVEGHCDERGTAEYNLALGERRAVSARTYLVSLGIGANRLRTVSYGREFPFDPGHDESAWSRNRRAHFVITAK